MLLNASLRGGNSNSSKFLNRLSAELNDGGELVNLSSYLERQDELDGILMSTGTVVLGMPMYVDGIPSALLRVMERLEKKDRNTGKNIFAANSGWPAGARKNGLKKKDLLRRQD